ncbi:MAG: hypothetical protein U0350_49320 [Caldilineaceae bacterium]
MTNLDVLSQILAHATGQPISKWRGVLLQAAEICPGAVQRLHQECPDAEQRLEEMKAEASGIPNWLLQGATEARQIMERTQ